MILKMGYPSLRHQENAGKSGNAGRCGCWPDTQSRCALLGEDNRFTAKATPKGGGTWLERSPSVASPGQSAVLSHSSTDEEASGFTVR
jgi:hypothetical protein